MGAKKHPFYRLVVADSRSPRDGRFIEHLGYYDPMTDPVKVKIDVDKVVRWLQQGAQSTSTKWCAGSSRALSRAKPRGAC